MAGTGEPAPPPVVALTIREGDDGDATGPTGAPSAPSLRGSEADGAVATQQGQVPTFRRDAQHGLRKLRGSGDGQPVPPPEPFLSARRRAGTTARTMAGVDLDRGG